MGVGVERQHLFADEIFDEAQRMPRRRVVSVGDPAQPKWAVEGSIFSDQGIADCFEQVTGFMCFRAHRLRLYCMERSFRVSDPDGGPRATLGAGHYLPHGTVTNYPAGSRILHARGFSYAMDRVILPQMSFVVRGSECPECISSRGAFSPSRPSRQIGSWGSRCPTGSVLGMIHRMASAPPVATARKQPPVATVQTSRGPSVTGRLGRFLATSLVASLAFFHSHLLWQRIASFTLFEPLVALRWGGAALLFAGFVCLQRAGISVIWGHKALILWLLVLLCHAGAIAPVEGHQPLAEPGLLLAVSFSELCPVDDPRRSSTAWASATRPPRGSCRHTIWPLYPATPRFLEPLSPRPPPIG